MLTFSIFLGGHTLSGACLETHALDELIPDWKEKGVYCAHQYYRLHVKMSSMLQLAKNLVICILILQVCPEESEV